MEHRIYHVDMSEIEVYQLFGEIYGRETFPNGSKMSRLRQMDALPF